LVYNGWNFGDAASNDFSGVYWNLGIFVGIIVCPTRAFTLARCGFSFVVDRFRGGDVYFRAPFF
jgi:hypothetical protein